MKVNSFCKRKYISKKNLYFLPLINGVSRVKAKMVYCKIIFQNQILFNVLR